MALGPQGGRADDVPVGIERVNGDGALVQVDPREQHELSQRGLPTRMLSLGFVWEYQALQQTAEPWNAPRHSLRSCPRREFIGSAAAERYPLAGQKALMSPLFALLVALTLMSSGCASRLSTACDDPNDPPGGIVFALRPGTGEIVGRVRRSVDSASLGEVLMFVALPRVSTATDTAGRFRLRLELAPGGRFALSTNRIGYARRSDTLVGPAPANDLYIEILLPRRFRNFGQCSPITVGGIHN